MSISTNLANRVRHTSLPKSAGLMPLFEAVVNSIHSIEEADVSMDAGKIVVEILRDSQVNLQLASDAGGPGREPVGEILGFKVTDNGVGFNDANIESFKTLDSDHKASKGCRGVGRLLWLKAFDRVHVSSDFLQPDGELLRRNFDFSAAAGVSGESVIPSPEGVLRGTTVHLDGFREIYRDSSRKTAEAISRHLFEHCLWYFIRPGGAPTILLRDGEEYINLDDVCAGSLHSGAIPESVVIKDVNFELTHVKLRTNTAQSHSLAFCAANRLVKEEPLKGKIPGLYGRISDGEGDFVYSCYVSSPLLDESVRSERTGFDIEDDVSGLFAGSVVSLADIRDAVITRAKAHLDGHLAEGRQRGMARVERFVAEEAPRYRPLLSRIPADQLMVDPAISNKDLELALHKQYADIERQMLAAGHEILRRIDAGVADDYRNDLATYLSTLIDIKKSDLANYVSHRRVIINLLERAIRRGDDGRYAREDLLHGLIMPLRTDSNDLFSDDLNLWLIDERLAFHNFLASDRTLSSIPITGSTEGREPDIVSLIVDQNPILVSEERSAPFSSLTIVEIKRPMRNDMGDGEDRDPIEQALGYLQRIRDGGVTTAGGRPLGNPSELPAYCYVIADLTPSMLKRCAMHDLTQTADGLGYFGYKKSFKAYVEVISFDRLVNMAKQRNRAFFDKLGLPT